jgi:tetratricopeptide (TPR) repeat protein
MKFIGSLIFAFMMVAGAPLNGMAQNSDRERALEEFKTGNNFKKIGLYEKAIEHYQQALTLYRKLGIEVGIAVNLNNIGFVYDSWGQYDKAIEYYQQALTINRKLGNVDAITIILNNIGLVYKSWGKYNKAIEYYQQALEINRKLGIEDGIARNLNNIGLVYRSWGKYDKAIEYYQKALIINRKLGIEDGIAENLNNIGVVYEAWGQYNKAIKFHQQALEINRKLGIEDGIATNLNNIGVVYESWGKYDKAIENYQQALTIKRKLGNEDAIATILNNIGLVYKSWGQYDKAIEYYMQALEINRKLGIEDKVATNLNNIGSVYDSWGQYDKAIEYYQQALTIKRKLGNEDAIATILNNIGLVYNSWGQYDKAIEYYMQALEINRKLGIEDKVATILSNIGLVYSSWDKYDTSMGYYQKALIINRKLGIEDAIATNLNNIASVYISWGKYDKAIEYYMQALEIFIKQGKEAAISTLFNNIGYMFDSWGQYDKAIEYYQQALEINRKLGIEDGIARNLNNIGLVYYFQEQYVPAIKHFVESINLKEKIRKTATGDDRLDYLASQIGTYRALISAYLLNLEPSKAFEAMEQSRSKLLAERLGGDGSEVNVVSVKSVQDEMGDASAILSYANSNWSKISLVVVARSSIHGQQIPAEEALGAILQKHEAAILTMLGNQREIKVVNKDSGQHLPRADKKSTLEKTINFYRKLLTNPSPENDETLREVAMALYDLLVKPIEPQLKGKKEIIIIPDGVLGFLPFETLIAPDGQYLVEKYAITYAQSMTVQQLIKNRKHEGTRKPMLAFGGAVYDEVSYKAEMVTNENQLKFIKNKTFLAMASKRSTGEAYASLGIGQLTNLPGTLEEVNAIAKIVENSDIISGKDVTESKIKSMSDSGELSQYKVLHFATHGMTVPEFPELSSIVLSQFKGGARQGRRLSANGRDCKAKTQRRLREPICM